MLVEAEYSLNAYHGNAYYGGSEGKSSWHPGFVISHSSGLSLVKPSQTGDELGSDGEDIRQNWRVTHIKSGRMIGSASSFTIAKKMLLLMVGYGVDWTLSKEQIAADETYKQILPRLRKDFYPLGGAKK